MLKGRPHAIKRAAWAAKTAAQIAAHRIVRGELEREFGKHYSLGEKLTNYAHEVAVSEFQAGRTSDIRTRTEKIEAWIDENEAIQEALWGYRDAKTLTFDLADQINKGEIAELSEDEISDLLGTIKAAVPEPYEYPRNCGCRGC